jgi:hypothetical protein
MTNAIKKIASSSLAMILSTSIAHGAEASSTPNDFDFLIGSWRVQHHQLKTRLAGGDEWIDFEGTTTAQKLMEGTANVDDNVLVKPTGRYRAVSLRAFDEKTKQWSIWWLDGRNIGTLDPPVRGGFSNGIGTFYGDDMLEGKPIRVRFLWSDITQDSCRWSQAFSNDGGKTWETNWVMNFTRVNR